MDFGERDCSGRPMTAQGRTSGTTERTEGTEEHGGRPSRLSPPEAPGGRWGKVVESFAPCSPSSPCPPWLAVPDQLPDASYNAGGEDPDTQGEGRLAARDAGGLLHEGRARDHA